MKRSLIKELLRDFWRNKSRFLSILAIVALGAGFFGGLKATSTDMKRTVDDYYKEQHLMDFRVVSTLGLTDADAADIRALDGVAAAAPAYRVDAILSSHSEEDGQRVMRVHSLTEEDGINQCLLLEGRLPQKADEAVVITSGLVDSNYQIGDSITIDTEADEEAAEALTIHSFTIVGFLDARRFKHERKRQGFKLYVRPSGGVCRTALQRNLCARRFFGYALYLWRGIYEKSVGA